MTVWSVIRVPTGEDSWLTNPSGEAAFELGNTLTIYEAARIASGRHPMPRLLDGADSNFYWEMLSAGSTSQGWRRFRPLRSVNVFHALMDAINKGEIEPVNPVYATTPGPCTKGTIDWRHTKVKAMDVARLCVTNGWHPKLLRPLIEDLQRELRESALLGGYKADGAKAADDAKPPPTQRTLQEVIDTAIRKGIRPGKDQKWPWKRFAEWVRGEIGKENLRGTSPRNIRRVYSKLAANKP
jgi:hypothetical protein